MQTKVSTKGQVVLPGPLRRRLGICAGDPLDANIEGGRIVLTPRKQPRRPVKIVTDPVTRFPVLSAGSDAPELSSAEVEEILANFP
jgi:AbrB family looped-hinge helix DNA binding protein